MRSTSLAPPPDDGVVRPPLLHRVVSAGQLRYGIICTWALVLATAVRLDWVVLWLVGTLASGGLRSLVEARLRRRSARPGTAWLVAATLSCVAWAVAPLLAWRADQAHGDMIAVGLICAGYMLVFTQTRAALREALVVSIPYSVVLLSMLASLWGTQAFWALLTLMPALAAALLIKVVVTQIRDREIGTADARQAALISQLETARDDAKAASSAKSNFLGVISHELRTPMNGVLGAAQLLDQGPLAPEQKSFVAIIRQSGESLLALLNDILDITKIEAGKMEVAMTEISMTDLHQRVVGPFRAQAEAKGLRLEAHVPADAPYAVRTDPLRLAQIIQNLLANAIKFTNHGVVRLIVTTRPTSDGRLARVTLSVEDEGVGISAEDLPRLFQPFTQVDASSTRRFAGTGLGLSIAKRMANLLGGDIYVRSRLGEGSTFSVTLEMEVTAWQAPREAAGRSEGVRDFDQGSRLRVLVVEDHPVNRAILEAFLRPLGHTVTTAENGQEAVAKSGLEPFDLIIMDVNMPIMDGLLATQNIRTSAGPNQETPIIILSASARREDHQRGFEAGGDAYIDKPVNFPAVLSVLNQAAGGRAAFASARNSKDQTPAFPTDAA